MNLTPFNGTGNRLPTQQAWSVMFICVSILATAQPHPNAHAHNDYEHTRPFWDALKYGFTSVEADVHLSDGKLLVAHDFPTKASRTLNELYLRPLDSLLKVNKGMVYPGYTGTFYLMIDIKTEAVQTFRAIQKEVYAYPALQCSEEACPVKIFISGDRPVTLLKQEGFIGIAVDGRPADLGKGYTTAQMPVVSDHFGNWCSWKGEGKPAPNDFDRIVELASRVHAEDKKLRLWAIPDHERAWAALLHAGVDLINTDRLEELHQFLSGRSK